MTDKNRKLRIGIVGLGGIAQSAHIPAYQKIPDLCEIVAGCDVNEVVRTEAAQKFNIPHVYATYEEMFDKENLDAISICTPPKFHYGPAMAAMKKGISVLCEKPVAMNAQEAQEMVDAAEKNHVTFMVAFQYRFTAEAQTLKSYIQDGVLGDIYFGHCFYMRRRGIPGWGVFTVKELSRGGPLIDIGVHIMDLTLWLMGYPKPVSVLGSTYNPIGTKPGINLMSRNWDPAKFETEDAAFAMIKFDNGATLMMEATWAINLPQQEGTKVAGTLAGAELNPLRLYGQSERNITNTEVIIPEWMKRQSGQDLKVKHFVEAVLNGTPVITKPNEIVDLAKLVDAIYESADTGQAVNIK